MAEWRGARTFVAFAAAGAALTSSVAVAASTGGQDSRATHANARDTGTGRDTPAGHARARLIVKFKDATDACVDCRVAAGRALAPVLGSGEFDRSAQRFGLRSIRPLVAPDAKLRSLKERKQRHRRLLGSASAATDIATTYVLKLARDTNLEKARASFERASGVEYAEPDYQAKVAFTPNDPYFNSSSSWGQGFDDLWGAKKINAPAAWDTTKGQGVVVAVSDTGVDYDHPDIAANIWSNSDEIPSNGIDDDNNGYVDDTRGWDFTDFDTDPLPDNDPFDDHGHGTHVAGTIAAVANNSIGIAGVAPEAKIMPIKGLGSAGVGFDSALADSLVYAAENGADVVNASWAGVQSNVIDDAVAAANEAGTSVVAAAGNDSEDVRYFTPAASPGAITVAASTYLDQASWFSNYGSLIDVSAPGGGESKGSPFERSILSLRSSGAGAAMTGNGQLVVGTNYLRQMGTSMAAPHASGVAALVKAVHPSYDPDQVRHALRAGADDIHTPGFDIWHGFGRLNAQRSIAVDVPHIKLDSPTELEGLGPGDGSYAINGTAAGAAFGSYKLEYGSSVQQGSGAVPSAWQTIVPPTTNPVTDGQLAVWTLGSLEDGTYTVRLTVTSTAGVTFQESRMITVNRGSSDPGPTLISRQSATDGGAGADGSTFDFAGPMTSADGRYVTFASDAKNLSADDLDDYIDIFVRDTQTNTTTLVSRQSAGDGGAAADSNSFAPYISADGRYVAFDSYADNLSTADCTCAADVFVRDMQANTTTLVSRQSASGGGAGAQSNALPTSISADGRFIAFSSPAFNLLPAGVESSYHDHIFVRDTQTNTTTLVSRQSAFDGGAAGDGNSRSGSISADGRFVAFESEAQNLSTADSFSSLADVFVRDMQTDTTTLVSRQSAAIGGEGGNHPSLNPSISADGRFVAFASYADNLSRADYDNTNILNAFVRDTQANTTELVSRKSVADGGEAADGASNVGSISADGRFVGIYSVAENLSPDDYDFYVNVFVHDTHTGTTELVSRQSAADGGAGADANAYWATISADGGSVTFSSNADNLSTEDNNQVNNVFQHEVTVLPGPGAITGDASPVRWRSATLNGAVNPNGSATTCHFDYGLNSGYGNSTPSIDAGSGSTTHSLNYTLTGLVPSKTYYFRLVCQNENGTTRGYSNKFSTGSQPVYRTKWGMKGRGDGQFSKPGGIAVDGSSNIYVADTGNNRVQVFDANGGFEAKWGTKGGAAGQFRGPTGVAVDQSGNVYVADTGNSRIQRCTSTPNFDCTPYGTKGSGDSQFNKPQGLAYMPSLDALLVADSVNGRLLVCKFSPTFDCDRFGSRGSSAPGYFRTPAGVAVDASGSIFVADTGNNRTQKCTDLATPASCLAWGSHGSGSFQFSQPKGIAVDDGYVYVADTGNNRIQMFDLNGMYKGGWASKGAASGQLSRPGGIASQGGVIYVADTYNNRVQAFQ